MVSQIAESTVNEGVEDRKREQWEAQAFPRAFDDSIVGRYLGNRRWGRL